MLIRKCLVCLKETDTGIEGDFVTHGVCQDGICDAVYDAWYEDNAGGMTLHLAYLTKLEERRDERRLLHQRMKLIETLKERHQQLWFEPMPDTDPNPGTIQ
jgi:hypothetical protein